MPWWARSSSTPASGSTRASTHTTCRRAPRTAASSIPSATPDAWSDRALAWLAEADARRPFFLWVHLWDPHAPYIPPPEFAKRAGNDAYLGEVAFADAQLGRLLQALPDGEVAVVMTSDHGEAFGEHGEVSHGAFCYDTTLRVPLIVRAAGLPPGRVERPVSVADVFPTLAELMGLAVPADIDGRSLFDDDAPPAGGAYFESYYGFLACGWSPMAGYLDADGKYVHSSRPQFFDLARDPQEEQDLAAERPGALARYRERLAEVHARPVLEAASDASLDPALRDGLRGLGYAALGGAATNVPDPFTYSDRPSPHSRAAEQRAFQRAMSLLTSGQPAEAERMFAEIVQANPLHVQALERLALARMRQNRHVEAIAPLESVVAAGPAHAETWAYLGACKIVAGREAEALSALRRAVEIDPHHVPSLAAIAQLLEEAGRGDEARAFRDRLDAIGKRR